MSRPDRIAQLFPVLFSGGSRLAAYKARTIATSPIAYWMLNETSGTTIVDSSGNSRNGTYSGVTLAQDSTNPQRSPAPLWDGVNDYGNVYSASLAGAVSFNEGCLLVWVKMSAAGVWTDGIARYLATIWRNNDNHFYIQKLTTSNSLRVLHRAGAASRNVDTTISTTDWFSVMLSWSFSGNMMRAYINGVQVGLNQTVTTTQSGSGLDNTLCNLGSFNAGGFVHSGYLAHATLWDNPANAAKIALATP